MPELRCRDSCWQVEGSVNLLDALLAAGFAVPYSCRAGSCQACLVRCIQGEPADARPQALDALQRERGWRLACQCQVVEDLAVELFDPHTDALEAGVQALDWLGDGLLRLRLLPQRPLRYQAGQHVTLYTEDGLARCYSLASLPQEDAFLEFHLDCRQPGAFCNHARRLQVGEVLRVGRAFGGALHYDPSWQEQPLLLLAGGSGLAPLYSILREALRQGHEAPIRLLHFSRSGAYLEEALQALSRQHANLTLEWLEGEQGRQRLARLAIASRREIALVCGRPGFVDACAKRLYLAGLPRGQVLSEAFSQAPAD
jgi:ferredoxin-NADP reductase